LYCFTLHYLDRILIFIHLQVEIWCIMIFIYIYIYIYIYIFSFCYFYVLITAQFGAETDRSLIHIFIKVCWLLFEIFIFVTNRATGIFHINFPKLICQTVRCRHLTIWRYIAGVRLVRISSLLAFIISSTGCH
jgi:hypothetical protein